MWAWLVRWKESLARPTKIEPSLESENSPSTSLSSLERCLAEGAAELRERLADQPMAGASVAPALPVLERPFEATRLIGRGGTGEVYEAIDHRLGRRVAIKIPRHDGGDERSRQNERLLLRESRFAFLTETAVVGIHSAGTLPDGRPYIVMEAVEGPPLHEYLGGSATALRQLVRLAITITRAVTTLHQRRIVHGDLKPANILITASGQTKLIDLSMARLATSAAHDLAGGGGPRVSEQSCWGGGTPGYRAPEVVKHGPIDLTADVFSLGVLFHELWTGCRPAPTASMLVSQPRSSSSPTVIQVSPQLPIELRAIIHKCLAFDPLDRYADAIQLLNDLERYQDGRIARALTGLRPGYRGGRFFWRHRRAGATLTVCLGLAALAFINNSTADRERARSAILAKAEASQRQQTLEQSRAADVERSRVVSQQHRQAVAAAARLVRERRVDDARRLLAAVPPSRWGLECDLLSRQTAEPPRPYRVLGAHDWGVVDVLASSTVIVSLGFDGRLLAWNVNDGSCRVLQEGRWSAARRQFAKIDLAVDEKAQRSSAIVRLAWLEPGHSFVSASLTGAGDVWRIGAGESRRFVRHGRPLTALAAAENQILFGDDRGALLYCESLAAAPRVVLVGQSPVTSIAPAASGRWLVGREDGALSLVDVQTGDKCAEVSLPGPVWAIAAAANLRHVAVGCQQPFVTLFEIGGEERTVRQVARFPLPPADGAAPRAIHALAYSPDAERLLAGDDLGRLTGFRSQGDVEFARQDQGASPMAVADKEHFPTALRRRTAGVGFLNDHAWVTAGDDTLIKEWRESRSSLSTTFKCGDRLLLAFDPRAAPLLWIGTADGTLRLIDADNARELAKVQRPAPIEALATASQTGVTIVAAGGELRRWRATGEHIEADGESLTYPGELRSIASTADGQRIAGLAVDGTLRLWDASTCRLLAERQFSLLRSNAGGPMAFNPHGDRLAVLGAGPTAYLLDGHDLQTLEQPALVAGQGGTALTWHPRHPEFLYAGDSIGRVARRPRLEAPAPDEWTGHAPIVSLALSPTGNRLLAATSEGRLVFFDPDDFYPDLVFDLPSETGRSPVTAMALNRDGRLLTASRQDGTVTILRFADNEPPPLTHDHRWTQTTSIDGAIARNLQLRPSAIARDGQGRMHALYLRQHGDADNATWRVILGCEASGGWWETAVRELGRLSAGSPDQIRRSLVLRVEGERIIGLAKLRPKPTNQNVPGLELISGRVTPEADQIERVDTVLSAPHVGFDPAICPNAVDFPAFFHFSHAGHCLLHTRQVAGRWQTEPVGRQGDGFRMHAAFGPEGRGGLLFHPTRFNGDGDLPTLLALRVTKEDAIDPAIERLDYNDHFDSTPLNVGAGPAGELVVLYRIETDDGQPCLMLARRRESGWTRQIVMRRAPPLLNTSNLLCSGDGVVRFAATIESDGQVWWCVCPPTGETRLEFVWRDPNTQFLTTGLARESGVALDATGNPIILVVRVSSDVGYLRAFRGARMN